MGQYLIDNNAISNYFSEVFPNNKTMSSFRNIEIRLLSNVTCLSELIDDMTKDFWNFKNESGTFLSIVVDDNGDFNYQEFNDAKTTYEILDNRENEGKLNAIVVWDKEYTESFGLLIHSLNNNYNDSNKHYLFSLTPDIAKRIQGANRLTDYGFYLNQLLPKLISLGCYICEVTCHDFDS